MAPSEIVDDEPTHIESPNDGQGAPVRTFARQMGSYRRRAHSIVALSEPTPGPPTIPRLQSLTWMGATPPSADPTLIVQNGDLDVEGTFRAATDSNGADGAVLFTATSSEGVMSFRYRVQSATNSGATVKVKGIDAFSSGQSFPDITTNQWRVGDLVHWRAWYRPNTSSLSSGQRVGLRITVNGVQLPDQTGAPFSAGIAAPTIVTPGTSLADPTFEQNFYANFNSYVPVATAPEILVLGDSTIAPFHYQAFQGPNTGQVASLISVAHDVYTTAQRETRPGIGILAVPSDTTAGQQAKFDASPWTTSAVSAVIIEVGINDRGSGASAVAGLLQTLVNDVRSKLPTCKILIAKLVPYTLFDGSTSFLFAINDDIMGAGANPITGVDGRIAAHYTSLDNGSGGYQPTYNFDQIHENNAGRALVAAAYKSSLQSVGVLP